MSSFLSCAFTNNTEVKGSSRNMPLIYLWIIHSNGVPLDYLRILYKLWSRRRKKEIKFACGGKN